MMMSEFIERTKYEPSHEEYIEIEEAYYEFDGNKDEFCKAWLKRKNNGSWAIEYNLRKQIRRLNEDIKVKNAELQTTYSISKEFSDKYFDQRAQNKALQADNTILRNRIATEEKKHPKFRYIALA